MLRRLAECAFAAVALLAMGKCSISPFSTATTIDTGDVPVAAALPAWDSSTAPDYYFVIGRAGGDADAIGEGEVRYGALDSMGRATGAEAKVTYSMVKESRGNREDWPSDGSCDRISGWGHQRKVTVSLSNGRSYSGYAFNRSHLLADSLGGAARIENVVTGTRTQNVGNNDSSDPGGMSYTETLARNYLYSHHNGWVYYRAAPVYSGGEAVCRWVVIDVESDDGSLDLRVVVFNSMAGYAVDYSTGELSER